MKFKLENNYNLYTLFRRIGYKPGRKDTGEEKDAIRPMGRGGYPRFHLYVKKDSSSKGFLFSLHLDQKRQSYQGSTAHSGDYDSSLVEQEAERIKGLVD